MRLDLHVHSTASDGAWTPAAVVRGAAAGRLDVIAIADHDTAAGFGAAEPIGRAIGVQVIPAIEVSSTWQGRDVHVLGYFIDTQSPALRSHAQRARNRREERMREMLRRLRDQAIEISFSEVEEAAGPDRVVIGRPHLAKALVGAGHAASVQEAFDLLIGDDRPAFVPTHLLGPMEAVELIVASGGIPVWAHPPGELVDELLPRMMGVGLRGLEVYRPRTHKHDVLRLEAACRSTGLFPTGGSDWHSPEAGNVLGDFFVTGDEVEGLLTAGGM